MTVPLLHAVRTRASEIDILPDALNLLLPGMIDRFNSDVAPRLLSRLPHEELPKEPRAASSFRARVSLLVEYALIEMMADFLSEESHELNVTFNTTNEFADFFIRDAKWAIEIRIDIKTLHDASEEASARFDTIQEEIQPDDDYLLYIAWHWQKVKHNGIEVIMPAIMGGVFISCLEIARERDKRQILAGGSFGPDGEPLAKSGIKDTNFGKVNRIVHSSRRKKATLGPRIQDFLRLFEVQAEAREELPIEMLELEEAADSLDTSGDVTDSTDDA